MTKPTEALFLQLAETDPARLVVWSRDPDLPSGLRARAAEALGHVKSRALAVPPLLELLDHKDPVVQEGALYGLGDHRTSEVMERLTQVARDEKRPHMIREIAAEILAAD